MKSPAGRLSGHDHVVRRATNFRRLREARTWGQVALAIKLNMAHTYITSMEAGARPITLKTVDKLAKVLGLTPVQVLAELDAPVAAAVTEAA